MIEYLNQNENRNYPLAENVSSAGLPQDVLADMCLLVPRELAGLLYVSSVTMTPALVSMAIASSYGGAFTLTLPRPVTLYRPYSLTALIPMASGYASFGRALDSTSVLQFISTSVETSGLDLKAVKHMDTEAVTSLGLYRGRDNIKLSGDIKLIAGTNVTLRYHDGKIKVGLVPGVASNFVGPCDRKALFANCGAPVLRSINGVRPDISGAITLEVQNA